jgi:tyrosine-protein phosphatase YwqE
MFSFFKKTPLPSFPFSELASDIHSHILPGIDDGAPDVVASLNLINGMLELGYTSFTGTPHVMEDMYRNNTETIAKSHATLLRALEENKMNIPVRAAAEYLMDGHFEKLLAEKTPLLTIKENWVLFEISFIQPPMKLKHLIFEMQLQGYQPVLAHPERYSFFYSKKAELQEIHSLGCLFQSNLLSFSGYYGPAAQQSAEFLAEKGFTTLLGTDLHHERHLDALRHLKMTKALSKVMGDRN